MRVGHSTSMNVLKLRNDEQLSILNKSKILTNDSSNLTRQEGIDMIIKVLMQMKGKTYNYSQTSINYANQDKSVKNNYKKTIAIATGGLARVILNQLKSVSKLEPFLTLEGLRIIYNRVLSNKSDT